MAEQSLRERTVLITGTNNGIGLVEAERPAGLCAAVMLVCCDAQRRRRLLSAMSRAARGAQQRLFLADLSRQAAIRQLAREVEETLGHLDVLISNAGAMFSTRELT